MVRESRDKVPRSPVDKGKTPTEPSLSISGGNEILLLQKTIGNRAVGRLLHPETLPGRLDIHPEDDAYERQADRVADQMMSIAEPEGWRSGTRGRAIQRAASPGTVMPGMNGGGKPLSSSERSYFEPRFGTRLDFIRVHTGKRADALARRMNARAFTSGRDVAFARGEYTPHSPAGKRLMAHELTHALQQSSGYRSPALAMRSRLRISSLARPAVQRKVNTWGGEWDTDRYSISQSGQRRSADIKLRFSPNDTVNAELIGLTQSVRTIHNKKPFYINSDLFYKGRAIQSGDAITVDAATGETDEGTMIDRLKSYNNPIYAVDTLPSTSLDDPSTSATWGQHGYHYKDSKGTLHDQDAILIDAPGIGSVDVSKDSAQVFETAALATKGTQAGTYYGSVRWGWRTDSKGNFSKIPLSKGSEGVPSSTFMKAAEIWNAAKSSTGAATVNLPLVDVKITTAPITGVYPPGFVGPPLSFPTGTRVEIIRNAVPPATNGEIRAVDGVFTGHRLEVTPADMANIRDERP